MTKAKKKPEEKETLSALGGTRDFGSILFAPEGGRPLQIPISALKASPLPEAIAELLADAHTRKRDYKIRCCCREEDPAHVHIRKDGPKHIACRNPATGQEHDPLCEIWKTTSGRDPWRGRPVRREDADRLFNPVTFGHAGRKGPAGNGMRRKSPSLIHKASQTLAGGLRALLDRGRFNIHLPNYEIGNQPSLALLAQVTDSISRGLPHGVAPRVVHGGALINVGVLPKWTGRHVDVVRPAMLIGSIAGVDADGQEWLVTLEGDHFAKLRVSSRIWGTAIKHAADWATRPILNNLGKHRSDARVLGAFEVVTVDGVVRALRVGLCATTRNFAPVDSQYELQMANALANAGRAYIKDLRIPEGGKHLHDFRLIDVDPCFIIEVNGRDDENYVTKKAVVEAYLQSCRPDHYAIWHARDGEPMPLLPPVIEIDIRKMLARAEAF